MFWIQRVKVFCSKCGEKATTANLVFRDTMRRFELIIHHCHKCGFVYIDKELNKNIIKKVFSAKNLCGESIESLYAKYLKILKDCVEANFISVGYKRKKFLRKK
jgi:uncharacterized Zn finger protein